MKKDIEVAKFEGVYVAVVQEWNDEYEWNDWVAYLINDSDSLIENVIVVSKGYGKIDGEDRKTATLRHGMKEVEAKSFAKVELIYQEALEMSSEFWVTFFVDNKLYDKKFIFKKNMINEKALRNIPHIAKKGVVVNF
ncbi:MAG: hypothetical protein KAH10_01990 [Flavobacteriales bacterium]|nr:hypothetical protein [Flavobacteriales bacterium]